MRRHVKTALGLVATGCWGLAGFALGDSGVSIPSASVSREALLTADYVSGRREQPAQEGADAHPDYWDNLFANTIRYEIAVGEERVEAVDLYFNEGGSVTSNGSAAGSWQVQGEPGSEQMCYRIEGVPGIPEPLSECFALVLMYNPRIGARWPSRFDQGVGYWAEVVGGRQ